MKASALLPLEKRGACGLCICSGTPCVFAFLPGPLGQRACHAHATAHKYVRFAPARRAGMCSRTCSGSTHTVCSLILRPESWNVLTHMQQHTSASALPPLEERARARVPTLPSLRTLTCSLACVATYAVCSLGFLSESGHVLVHMWQHMQHVR
jgi:hypothetical protein